MTRRALIAAAVSVVEVPKESWLAFDLSNTRSTGNLSLQAPICFGSLLKPILAVAFAATHASFPVIRCAGASSRCWYAPGHGEQNIVSALANSCNTYFLQTAATLDPAALETVALQLGLAAPERTLTPERLVGLAHGWPQFPHHVTRAFAALATRSGDPAVSLVLRGMELCAQTGTARAAHFACYAKTGTAPCSHLRRAPGDGFALAMYPLDRPRRVLLVEAHGTTGAVAASGLKAIAARIV
jgi:cell division protein FtsI/penicillin-binding protein 2